MRTLAVFLSAIVLTAAPTAQSRVPAPESVFGFLPGADYKLATYDQSIEYFKKLAASSRYIRLAEAGKTTQGRTMYFALISTPENLARIDRYREIWLRLAHPEIRVLILSGHDASTFVQRAVRAGAQGFVSKAQDIREIMRGVEAILSGYSVFPVTSGAVMAPLVGAISEQDKLELLSDKELVVLQMLAKGMSNKTIGEALFISNKTVSSHKARIMHKLGVHTLVSLVDFARRCGIASTQQ